MIGIALQSESTAAADDGGPRPAADDREVRGRRPAEDPAGGLDSLLEILQNRRRRAVLRLLADGPARTDIGTLARRIAAMENDKPPGDVTTTERKRVYAALHQCHLPKMDAAGAVSFDKPRGTVEPGPETDRFLAALRTLGDCGRRSQFATGVAVGVLLIVGLVLVLEAVLGPIGPALGVLSLGAGAALLLRRTDRPGIRS